MTTDRTFLMRCSKVFAVIVAFELILCCRVQAAWVGSEGDEWLNWDAITRQAYVRAYVKGLQSGFSIGCDQGIFAVNAKMKGGNAGRFAHICMSHNPISDRDSMRMVSTITEFYTKYPKERFLYISEILLNLHAGLSIDQIHEHFAGTQP